MSIPMTASEYAEKIVLQYELITATPEITISDDTLGQLHSFLSLLSNNHDAEFSNNVLEHPSIQEIKPNVQSVFSRTSSLYERHWAHRILSSDMPRVVFEQKYPYYQHYERATALEISAIRALASGAINNALMIGSGALPVTSMALATNGFKTENLDIDQADLELGKDVSEALGVGQAMTFTHSDICHKTDLAEYDVIWLAALVGDEAAKTHIINHLFKHMAPGGLLVVRTAYNLRTLLYPSTSERDLEPFSMKLKIQTYADNFHSILIAQKPL